MVNKKKLLVLYAGKCSVFSFPHSSFINPMTHYNCQIKKEVNADFMQLQFWYFIYFQNFLNRNCKCIFSKSFLYATYNRI